MESGVHRDVLEIVNDIRSVKVDLQVFQLGTTDGNRKEAGDGCGAGVLGTRVSEDEGLQSRQGHSDIGHIAVV